MRLLLAMVGQRKESGLLLALLLVSEHSFGLHVPERKTTLNSLSLRCIGVTLFFLFATQSLPGNSCATWDDLTSPEALRCHHLVP